MNWRALTSQAYCNFTKAPFRAPIRGYKFFTCCDGSGAMVLASWLWQLHSLGGNCRLLCSMRCQCTLKNTAESGIISTSSSSLFVYPPHFIPSLRRLGHSCSAFIFQIMSPCPTSNITLLKVPPLLFLFAAPKGSFSTVSSHSQA